MWYDVQLYHGQKYFHNNWSFLSEYKTSWAQLVNKMSRLWCNMIGNGVTKTKVIINVFNRIYLNLKWPYSIDSLVESLVQTICFHTIVVLMFEVSFSPLKVSETQKANKLLFNVFTLGTQLNCKRARIRGSETL